MSHKCLSIELGGHSVGIIGRRHFRAIDVKGSVMGFVKTGHLLDDGKP
jgi:hypothetical protein